MKECPKTCGVCTVSCMDHDPGCKGWAAASGGKLCESEEDKVLSSSGSGSGSGGGGGSSSSSSCASPRRTRHCSMLKVLFSLPPLAVPQQCHPPCLHAALLTFPTYHPQAFMLRICPSSCGICTEMDKDEL